MRQDPPKPDRRCPTRSRRPLPGLPPPTHGLQSPRLPSRRSRGWAGAAVPGALALLLLAAGCQDPAPVVARLSPVESPHGTLTPLPDPDGQEGHVGRAARRLTVKQLDRSIRIATGREWKSLATLAPSLGQADYSLINTEGTEPNLVFAKFLEDGAREVCLDAARADLKATAPADRVLIREFPSAIPDLRLVHQEFLLANLGYLSLRFWGQPLQEPEIDRWAELFRDAARQAETVKKREQALAVLCIAFMTDPRFLTY